MTLQEREALIREWMGKLVEIGIDRPIGYVHHKGEKTLVYPVNYGYIPGVLGGDGEELDVYLLGVDHPVEKATVEIIAAVKREDDEEDKLIGVPPGVRFTVPEMESMIAFQEKYYKSKVVIE